jgi:curli production protein
MDGAAIDLWLDWQLQSQPAIVVPYVKSASETALRYRVVLKKAGRSGQASIAQGGTLELRAGVAAPLSRISIDRSPGDGCRVEVTLLPSNAASQVRRFDCPEP